MGSSKDQLKTEIEALLLKTLNDVDAPIENSLNLLAESKSLDVKHHSILQGVVKSLEASGFVTSKTTKVDGWLLTAEGKTAVEKGSPEARLYNAVAQDGSTSDEAAAAAGFTMKQLKVAQGQCMKNKWVKLDRETKKLMRAKDSIEDEVRVFLTAVEQGQGEVNAKTAKIMKKRKLVEKSSYQYLTIQKGEKFAAERVKPVTDLTADMLKSGAWETAEFKSYNFQHAQPKIDTGCLHPLLKVRQEFREILLSMGFSEMPTNNFVESSFWNFDALFQPQQHPARDAHDTFFLSAPAKTLRIPQDYLEVVKDTHETGGSTGSIGYRCDWSVDETEKNILRTHTTAVSSRMLYKLAQEYKSTGEFTPKKYFSIDRVFRNESLDATHLAEFHQVEGLVADRNLTLGDLMGTIKSFFSRIGIDDVRFKPAYNPYTEPSMEIFGYSKSMDKWMEVGNSGMFRPEMLLPMGLPEDVRVIAWGLSLERPTMIKYGINNIRDLFGHKVKLSIIEKNPICRF